MDGNSILSDSGLLLVAKVLSIGVLVVGGIVWQFFVIGQDDERKGPTRLIFPVCFSAIVFVGYLVYGILSLLDERKPDFGYGNLLGSSFRALVFGLLFTLKSYLGPSLIGLSLAVCTYHIFEYGELRTIEMAKALLGWVFSYAPEWAEHAYLILLAIYLLTSSVYDSVVKSGKSLIELDI